MKKHDNNIYYVWLSDAIGRSYKVYRELIDTFGSVYDIYAADDTAYSFLSAKVGRCAERLCDKSLTSATKICDYCAQQGISILTYEDERYPSLLREIEDPPLALYVRGKMPDFEGKLHVAVVGTRKMTEYGKCVAYNIGYSLSKNGAVVVSGMALGNDSVAMCAALDAGRDTIGVLGCGVDIAYPPQHAQFMKHIANAGTLISEYPPGTKAEPKFFPMRNRIISGLCRATLVVEADTDSGALITARKAEEQGRQLYAVPGKIGETSSEGTLSLISKGAKVSLCANDILKEYAFLYRGKIDLKTYEQIPSERIDVLLSARGISAGKAKYLQKPETVGRDAAHNGKSTSDKKSQTKAGHGAGILSAIKLKMSRTDAVSERAVGMSEDEAEKAKKIAALSDDVAAVYKKLPKNEMFSADDISRYGVGAREFMSAMTMLEIHGLAHSFPGSRYTVE